MSGSKGAYTWPWMLAEWLIGIVALLVRLHYITVAVVPNAIRGDAVQYYNCAWNLVHHFTFSSDPPASVAPDADSFRDPGFPLLFAAWLKFSPDSYPWYWGVLISNAVLGALTVMLVMWTSKRWLPASAVLVVGVVAALWPHSITNCGYLLTEVMFGFLCAAAVWVTGGIPTARWPLAQAVVAGLTYGLAALTNAVLTPFPLVLGFIALQKRWFPKRVILAFLVSALTLPTLWTIRSVELPTATGKTSGSRAVMNLVQGSYPGFLDAYNDAVILRAPEALELYREVDAAQMHATAAPIDELSKVLRRLAGSPLHSLKWYLIDKPMMLWGWSIRVGMGDIYIYPTQNSPFDFNTDWKIIASVAHGLNAPFGIFAGIFSIYVLIQEIFRRSNWAPKDQSHLGRDLAALLFAYVSAIYVLFQAEPRYATPFRGIEFSLSISAILLFKYWIDRLRKQRTSIESV